MGNHILTLVAGMDLEAKNFLNSIFAIQRTLVRLCGAEDSAFKAKPGVPETALMTVRYTEGERREMGKPLEELEEMFERLTGFIKAITRGKDPEDVDDFYRTLREIMGRSLPKVVMTTMFDQASYNDNGTFRLVLTFTTDDQYCKFVFTDSPLSPLNDPQAIKIYTQTSRGAMNLSV